MGGAIGAGRYTNKASPEYFAFKVLQGEYERRKEKLSADVEEGATVTTEELSLQPHMVHIYNQALREFAKPIECCRCPSVVLHLYLSMDDERRRTFHQSVLENAQAREKAAAVKAAAANKASDYSQSFGGTAADTKNEREAAAILRGEAGSAAADDEEQNALYPFLVPPSLEHSYDRQQLRQYGRWGRFLGGTGCYLYLHYLTKEVVSIRPEDYSEDDIDGNTGDDESAAVEARDPANGLRRIDLADLQGEVDRIVKEGNKTPLLIDTSKTGAVRAFYTYKGYLEDVSPLTVPFGKSGVKKEHVMERCRAKLVAALKTGGTFALYLGDVRIEHADFKNKLCKKDVFPKEVFQSGGTKLLEPEYEPRYKAVFREQDLEAGQAIAREGFRCVVITSLDPYEFQAALEDSIPLGYMEPVYVNPTD